MTEINVNAGTELRGESLAEAGDSHAPTVELVRDDPDMDNLPSEILRIDRLSVSFKRGGQETQAVRDVSLSLRPGRILGVAGESGCGKTASALAVMGLLPSGTRVEGSIRYRGQEILGLPERKLRALRGRAVSMVFQETVTALNPVLTVGEQLRQVTKRHFPGSRREVKERVVAALADVKLDDAPRLLRSYPQELSGGMCQRVVIAMALACDSQVLLADEPTTALDVSVQAEILRLVRGLADDRQLAVMLISHDLGVLAEVCDDLAVMYDGEVVEAGPALSVIGKTAHPYSQMLLDSLPSLGETRTSLLGAHQGMPRWTRARDGCSFASRCEWALPSCDRRPLLERVEGTLDREARCWRAVEVLARPRAPREEGGGA